MAGEKQERKYLWVIILLLLLLLGLLVFFSYLWQQWLAQGEKLEKARSQLEAEFNQLKQETKELKNKLAEMVESASTSTESATKPKTTKKTSLKILRECGYIKKIYKKGGRYYLDIDYIQFLTGEAANEAAREDGEIGPGETVPNDYYIRNVNPKIRTFLIDNNVEVFIQTIPGPEMTIEFVGKKSTDFASFKQRFETENASRNMPHWITLEDSVVVKIEEQYVP
jgi:cell division protein FtsB